jgi:hypothetical protein
MCSSVVIYLIVDFASFWTDVVETTGAGDVHVQAIDDSDDNLYYLNMNS